MKRNILKESEYYIINDVCSIIKKKIKNKDICNFALSCIDTIIADEYSIQKNYFMMKNESASFEIDFLPSVNETKIIKISYDNQKTNSTIIQIEFKEDDKIEVIDYITWDQKRSERVVKSIYEKYRLSYVESCEEEKNDMENTIISKKMTQKIDKDGNYVMSYIGKDNASEEPVIERFYKGKTEFKKLYNNRRRKVVKAVKL